MSVDTFKSRIALQLKTIRKTKGWSLDTTAKATGVSKAMLGQIERQESCPTIATLWKIANGLETSFSAFFANEEPLRNNASDTASIFPDDPVMQVKTVFAYSPDTRMEMLEVTLMDYHQQHSSPHATGVIEHAYVMQGEVEVLVSGQSYILKSGDNFRFHADQPHSYRAITETAVSII